MPSPLSHIKPQRPVRRLVVLMALLLADVFVLAFVVTFAGILLLGGIEHWQQWLDDHAGHFFVWRLCLYVAVAAAWPWVRRHRLARDPQSRQQLRVIEVLGVLGIVLYEASNWLRMY
ncbi:hypothetical protein [Stutzerimonas kirkiae]|uniref:Uncharacterized protein n=1 Tax=Stutzerimonas kirkiae TaxID=2211392 RepID=A0A4Q9RBU8_9GAMM|nr:hypothetical protein [Stutzerimonas kirkiae]TBU98248.1 hypothetical protein DNJ96_05500 [Stutzerimonas kirkiae]TBV00922.1 hypothetical protein DNJ95_13370 [Stutzerimonas kirkiae]TBV07733.1 hypothetical protein DNK08_11925 [Stutzerimonas kirkiae]